MVGPKERERMIYRRDGNIFEVLKITKDFVILQALNAPTQIMTGKKSFEFLFEKSVQGEGNGSKMLGQELL